MMTLRGAWPMAATAASPRRTRTLPCALESSTSPSSTVSEVLPPSPIDSVQSVPRMAAVAAGVATDSPCPPRSARAQIVPDSRLRAASAVPARISLTRSAVLRPSRIWVRSSKRSASWPVALVRSTSPATTSWRRSTDRQSLTSTKRISSPYLRAITAPTVPSPRWTGSAAAGRTRTGAASTMHATRIFQPMTAPACQDASGAPRLAKSSLARRSACFKPDVSGRMLLSARVRGEKSRGRGEDEWTWT